MNSFYPSRSPGPGLPESPIRSTGFLPHPTLRLSLPSLSGHSSTSRDPWRAAAAAGRRLPRPPRGRPTRGPLRRRTSSRGRPPLSTRRGEEGEVREGGLHSDRQHSVELKLIFVRPRWLRLFLPRRRQRLWRRIPQVFLQVVRRWRRRWVRASGPRSWEGLRQRRVRTDRYSLVYLFVSY